MAEYNYRGGATVRCDVCGATVKLTSRSVGKRSVCYDPACIAEKDRRRREAYRQLRVKRRTENACDKCGKPRRRTSHNEEGVCIACEPNGVAVSALIAVAKKRAASTGVPFDLSIADLMPFPDVCLYLGVPLRYRHPRAGALGGIADNSASLDRVDPGLGYVRGNVVIVSRRANTIKNDATPEELRRISGALEKLNHFAEGAGNRRGVVLLRTPPPENLGTEESITGEKNHVG